MLKTLEVSQVKENGLYNEALRVRKYLIFQSIVGTIIVQLIVIAFFVIGIATTMQNMNNIIQYYHTLHNLIYEYREYNYFFGFVLYEEGFWVLVDLLLLFIIIFLVLFLLLHILKILKVENITIYFNRPKLKNFIFFFFLNCVLFMFSFFHYNETLFRNIVSYNSHVSILRREDGIYIFKYIFFFGKV